MVVRSLSSPGRNLITSAAFFYSHAGRPLFCNGAMRRWMKSDATISTFSPAARRRRMRVVAMVSFLSSGSAALQSLPRTGFAFHTLQTAWGCSSWTKHHLPCHSSNLSR